MAMKFTGSFRVSVSVDRSAEKKEMADITPEERERYVAWWGKFKMLSRTG
jgi:hypothetical protein